VLAEYEFRIQTLSEKKRIYMTLFWDYRWNARTILSRTEGSAKANWREIKYMSVSSLLAIADFEKKLCKVPDRALSIPESCSRLLDCWDSGGDLILAAATSAVFP
jgi:hypothetical protein